MPPAALSRGHPRDDQKLLPILFRLRTMRNVDHIFHGQGMDAELLGDRLQEFHVAKPLDVDPGDALVIDASSEIMPWPDNVFLDAGGRVTDYPDFCRQGIG